MKAARLISLFIALFCIIVLSSCKQDEGNGEESLPTPVQQTNGRNVKFEIIGTYTGQLNVVYTLEKGGPGSVVVSSLPWVKELQYDSSVVAISISAIGKQGTSGQNATLNLYSDGKVISTGSAIADDNGAISLPSLSYVFQ